MKKRIAIIASWIHSSRQKHLLDWYEDLTNEAVRTQLFLGSKNKNIPLAKNYKINSKWEELKYRVINPLSFSKKLAALQKIKPLVNFNPETIHLLTSNVFQNIEPILDNKNIKLIVSFRGFDINVFPKQSEENLELTQRIFKRANVLHFISEDLKRTALYMNADPEKSIVIHRSIRARKKENPKLLKPESNRMIIFSAGRLVWEKGYIYALETMSILKAEGYNFEYQIAGQGVDYDMLVHHTQRLNIQDRVKFLGELSPDKLEDKMMKADIYFQASVSEALSLAIMEASYFHLPIVSSNIGGIPEVVENNVSGFLSTPCDPRQYANGIIKLMLDRDLRMRMGNKAHKNIIHRFSREKEIQKWKELYKNI